MAERIKIKRILVADREIEYVKSLQRHLRRKGFSVDTAVDAEQALEMIKAAESVHADYDLIVTDVGIAHAGTTDMLEWVKEHDLLTSLVLVAGLGSPDPHREHLRAELDACTTKPLRPAQMMSLIKRLNRNRFSYVSKNGSIAR
ncbi:MAG: response regulator [Deltaproteobacteria bacterium]|nr:response regulator [Deltaproteobacteria bacterium]